MNAYFFYIYYIGLVDKGDLQSIHPQRSHRPNEGYCFSVIVVLVLKVRLNIFILNSFYAATSGFKEEVDNSFYDDRQVITGIVTRLRTRLCAIYWALYCAV